MRFVEADEQQKYADFKRRVTRSDAFVEITAENMLFAVNYIRELRNILADRAENET